MKLWQKTIIAAMLIFGGIFMGKANAAQEITVSAAASLTNAFTELKNVFEKQHPDIQVNVNFAASNPLLAQIKQGAPVDVFASADQATMDQADKAKVINPATRKNFVENELVLIVPKGSKQPKSLEDLVNFKKIAIGTPESVPAGRYTKEALEKVGLWQKLQPNFVQGASVRQTLEYVARGEADAGFVYATDAQQQKDKVDVVQVVGGHEPVTYPIAIVTTGSNPKGAEEFINFVLSKEGMDILKKYGFAQAK